MILRRWWPLAAVLLLLAVVTLATARSSAQFGQVAPPPRDQAARPTELEQAPTPRSEPSVTSEAAAQTDVRLPGWVSPLLRIVCLLLAASVLVALAWYGVRDRLRARADEPDDGQDAPRRTTEEVVAALEDGLVELSDTDRDPRRAVIACWVRLERAAAAAGTPRGPGDAPADLVARLLRGHRVSAEVLSGFADVYREARYATHTIDEAMRTQARSALTRLRAELAAGATTSGAS
ncbi:MAG TPA: DUF4129 domain-containing protein [Micromonosporaceae bacterium]|jgi:hypothetical protein